MKCCECGEEAETTIGGTAYCMKCLKKDRNLLSGFGIAAMILMIASFILLKLL